MPHLSISSRVIGGLSIAQHVSNVILHVGILIIVSAESIFFVRTYAIWERSKRVLWAFVATVIFIVTPVVGILVKYNSSTTVTNWIATGVPGCSKTGETSAVLYVYVLMVIAELEILCLTLYRAIAKYRRERRANVLRVLVQHNVFYFIGGVGMKSNAFVGSSIVLIIAIAIFPPSYSDVVSSMQITVHAALVTRMHRTLWRYNEHYAHSDEFTLTTFGAPPPLRTVQSAVGYLDKQFSTWRNLLGDKDRDHTPMNNIRPFRRQCTDDTLFSEWRYNAVFFLDKAPRLDMRASTAVIFDYLQH
ncbi:hypothetical protein F4604DRAFT_1928224 [Suillus subluteus]|nr:hypothetical protein F4604DRAFT_1928224 [Suillus subluteus]